MLNIIYEWSVLNIEFILLLMLMLCMRWFSSKLPLLFLLSSKHSYSLYFLDFLVLIVNLQRLRNNVAADFLSLTNLAEINHSPEI